MLLLRRNKLLYFYASGLVNPYVLFLTNLGGRVGILIVISSTQPTCYLNIIFTTTVYKIASGYVCAFSPLSY